MAGSYVTVNFKMLAMFWVHSCFQASMSLRSNSLKNTQE